MGQTLTEKILSRVMQRPVSAGETIYPEPDLVTVHDWYVVNFDKALQELGVDRLYDADKVLIATDHEPIALNVLSSERQRNMRKIAQKYGIKRFFDNGRGGHGHVFPMELGYVTPGMFVLAYDTHVTNYGAVGALGIPMITEITDVLACGSVWIRIPETIRVNLTGKLPAGITMRDISQKLTVDQDAELVDYCTVEFGGPALKDISVDQRMTLCNTPLEIGAKSAIVEPDQVVLDWLSPRVSRKIELVKSDRDAHYKQVFQYDLGILEPQVAAPPRPDNVVGISAVAGTQIHQAFIGSCANGSLSDMRDAARILKGRKIDAGVRLIITPATQEIWARAAAEGLIEVFAEAGALLTAPGCGPCAGGRIGAMAPGEVSINTGTRNDPGRLGTTEGQIYLASPLTVAASAVAGRITDPRQFL
ncbi:MAG TPA: aconitase/3-isopropylmalate dehydratase large subunit family protein [Burkholderiales bacterium]